MKTDNKAVCYALFEDEYLTTTYITNTVANLRPSYRLVATTDTVTKIEKLIKETLPDFIISGIKLSDGLSITELKRINCPLPTVIYTGYANCLPLAEGLNVVHTALKPVPMQSIEISLQKVEEAIAIDNNNIH